MQAKLKAAFRSSSRKRQSNNDGRQSQDLSTYSRGGSLDERRRVSSDSANGNAQHHRRSRPTSSHYDKGSANYPPGSQPHAREQAQTHDSEPVTESIANDYHAYLPALSPIGDSNDDNYMTSGGDRRPITAHGDGNHEEEVADRNIIRNRNSMDAAKRKPLPAVPVPEPARRHDTRRSSVEPAKRHDLRRSSIDPEKRHDLRRSSVEPEKRHDPRRSSVERTPIGSTVRAVPSGESTARHIKGNSADEIQKVKEQLLHGVVDLRNTVDTDREVTVAPAVIHEVVKPHQHEVIQHKIYREIHNYEHYYSVQPVYDLQVLPPRHWIPDPKGSGLIEVSADTFPWSTGDNRKWEIVQKHVVPPPSNSVAKRRTQPEIIQHPSQVTEEGFERKETTIIYPPTIDVLKDYDGLVQPVHFDHKTGRRWLGEVVHMGKVQSQIDEFQNGEGMNMDALRDNLPEVHGTSRVQTSSSPNSPTTRRSGRGRTEHAVVH